MDKEIDCLVKRLEILEVSLADATAEVSHIRRKLADIVNPRAHTEDKTVARRIVLKEEDQRETASRSLHVGDRVRILNSVKLTGHAHPVHNCVGTIKRFTRSRFVVISVRNKKRPSHLAGDYDEIRRERQNVELTHEQYF